MSKSIIMKCQSEFPAFVIEKIGYYVYLLIDPKTEKVFYVGKGTGNRLFAHVNDALVNPDVNDKLSKIRAIRTEGLDVQHVILRHGLTEKEAFEIEAALIDFIGLPELTNRVAGYETNGRGRMTADEMIIQYGAPSIEILEPALLIIVNKLFERNISDDRLYEITRGNWVLGERRNAAKYAFAVYNGIVRQVYKIHDWFPVTARTAESRIQERWRFNGEIAKELQHYIGGSVEQYSKMGAQNPVKYLNC